MSYCLEEVEQNEEDDEIEVVVFSSVAKLTAKDNHYDQGCLQN
jgi:hypothetical protein